MTGAGWEPGETVSLLFHEEVDPQIHPDKVLSAVADADGHRGENFVGMDLRIDVLVEQEAHRLARLPARARHCRRCRPAE